MRIRLKSQAFSDEILAGSWRLARKERFKKVQLRRDLNEEERVKLNKLWEEAMEKNRTKKKRRRRDFIGKSKT